MDVPINDLGPRERAIMELINYGYSDAEIAALLVTDIVEVTTFRRRLDAEERTPTDLGDVLSNTLDG